MFYDLVKIEPSSVVCGKNVVTIDDWPYRIHLCLI